MKCCVIIILITKYTKFGGSVMTNKYEGTQTEKLRGCICRRITG